MKFSQIYFLVNNFNKYAQKINFLGIRPLLRATLIASLFCDVAKIDIFFKRDTTVKKVLALQDPHRKSRLFILRFF